MSGERTEKPTAKKLREARREGRVPRSSDFTGTAVLVGALAATVVSGSWALAELQSFTLHSIVLAIDPAAAAAAPAAHLRAGLEVAVRAVGPTLLGAFVLAAVVGFLQTGPVFAVRGLIPDANRLNIGEGLARLGSKDRLVDLVKNVARLTIMLLVASVTFGVGIRTLLQTSRGSLPGSLQILGGTAALQLQYLVLTLLVFAVIDLLWQRHRFMREHMMTKAEVKDEHKQSEGDPTVRAQRRRAHQEILRDGGIAHVRDADVVVVNPTHVAAAIRYREQEASAPKVVASGRGELARNIRREARRHGVPIVRNVLLARSLAEVAVDEEIPADLYEAVAEVLHFVYSLGTQEEQ